MTNTTYQDGLSCPSAHRTRALFRSLRLPLIRLPFSWRCCVSAYPHLRVSAGQVGVQPLSCSKNRPLFSLYVASWQASFSETIASSSLSGTGLELNERTARHYRHRLPFSRRGFAGIILEYALRRYRCHSRS